MKTLIRTFCLVTCWLMIGAIPTQAGQAKVLSADDNTIKIGAGVDRGVRIGMLAEIYRQAAPLIHPVTGEDLLGLVFVDVHDPRNGCWRRGWDSNPRSTVRRMPVFKTGALSRSTTPPCTVAEA